MDVTPSNSKRHACAHDIRDGIGRAHFVEMHVLDRHLMHGRFGFGEPLEHGCGVLLGALRQRGFLDHFQNVRQVPMRVCFLHAT
jgi:hypothetical protein